LAEAHNSARRRTEGTVITANNTKTRVIAIEQRILHKLYGRVIRRTAKFVAHDEGELSKVGDIVRIEECRPLSKRKRWRVLEVLR
jgi:small subunit ribosomal protein S17